MTDMNERDFRIVAGKGFALDLPNGVTVSVQFGPGNYVDSDVRNADFDAPGKTAAAGEVWGSNLAECAAYLTAKDSDGAWVAVPGYTGPAQCDEDGQVMGTDAAKVLLEFFQKIEADTFYDDVVGHLNVEQVLDFINEAGKLVILHDEGTTIPKGVIDEDIA